MKAGGGKAKGSAFERKICELLSLWVSHGKDRDLFWRSAMSGGRSTVAMKKGVKLNRQAGDICAVAPEGHKLTDRFYFELKFYRDLGIDRFILLNSGPLARFWRLCRREAKKYRRRPVLIAKQNGMPVLLICETGSVLDMHAGRPPLWHWRVLDNVLKGDEVFELYLFHDVLAFRFGDSAPRIKRARLA